MIFSEKSIEDILNNKKQQTRRLVKEGEELITKEIYSVSKNPLIDKFVRGDAVVKLGSKKKTKWQVRKDYAVQSKRGGKGLWYCPELKKQFNRVTDELIKKGFGKISEDGENFYDVKPLRIKITGIRKERLLDISEKDAKKEGYDSRMEFFFEFSKINKSVFGKKCNFENSLKTKNAEVWVLEFEVFK